VGTDHPLIPGAVAAPLTHIDVYRTDYLGLAAVMSAALADTVAAHPEFAQSLLQV
jgi:(1->4)-alpha-D-glucan 1-alpha-D-glucosylmutase